MPFCGTWDTAGSGFWWALPLFCSLAMVAMAFACFRVFGHTGGRAGRRSEVDELRREFQELKEHVDKALRNPA